MRVRIAVCRAVAVFLTATMPHGAAASTPGYDHEYLITTWQSEDGLLENSATAMVQLQSGYLCFGTFDGLVQFDGVTFSALGNPTQLPTRGAGIVNLHLDHRDRLWVSSYDGLSIIDDEVTKFDAGEGWTGDYVRSFSERKNGDLYLTTYNEKIFEFSKGRFRELPRPGMPGAAFVGHVDSDDRYWVASSRFIGHWDGEAWITFGRLTPKPSVGCGPARDGGAWILSDLDLRKYVGGEEAVRIVLPEVAGGFWSLMEDSDGNVWISTFNRGVCRIGPNGEMRRWTTDNGLMSDGVRFAFEDRERNIWIGTSGGGLVRFTPRRFRSIGVEHGLPRVPVTTSCLEPGGSMLIGTYGFGLFRWDGSNLAPVPLPDFSNAEELYVQSVLRDRAGRLWVGLYEHGLALLGGGEPRWIPPLQTGGDNILALFEDSRGDVWISGSDGVCRFSGNTFHAQRCVQGDSLSNVFCFAEDRSGTIWLANSRGVYRHCAGGFVPVHDEHGELLKGVTTLVSDSDGSMWIATDGTLLRMRDDRISRIGEMNLLRSVRSMLQDDSGYVWITTPRGVVRVHRRDLHAAFDGSRQLADYQIFDQSDGLPTLEFAGARQPVCARDAAGRLWFTTTKGVVVTDPKLLRLNETPPAVDVHSITYAVESAKSDLASRDPRAAGENVVMLAGPFRGSLILPAGTDQLEFQYNALSFTAPEKIRFQVMLQGADSIWHDAADRRSVSYFNLAPGDYRFRLRAANNDGVWNETGTSVMFSIAPFFWETVWFQSLFVLLALAIFGGFFWWAAHVKHRRQKQSEEWFRLVVDSSPSALIVANEAGEISMANQRAEAIFGYDRAELVTRTIDTLIPVRHWSGEKSHDRVIADHREVFGRRKDGSAVPLEVDFSSIRTSNGTLVLASLVDTTERRRAAAEATRQRSEMAHLSRVTMIGELSGALAHELNQPLAAILSNAQAAQRFLVQDETDLAEVREILADIVEQDRRAGEVIHRLHLLLKKGEVRRQPFDLNDAVGEVFKLLRSELMNHEVSVAMEMDELPAIVNGDRVQLQQVLLNLIMNSCDAMDGLPPSERQLTVRTKVSDDAVEVSICDCGCGIAPENENRIFEPFFSTKTKGMGLGLAVCRTIMEAHEGVLRAANNEGSGACFHCRLPVYQRDGEQ